jgi:DNA polymerase-3 subunit delta'
MVESPLGTALVGQDRALGLLSSFLGRDTFPPLLLVGQPGVGKRTAAIQLARAANCTKAESPTPASSLLASPSALLGCGACRHCRTIALLRHPDIKVIFPIKVKQSRADQDEASDDEPGTPDVVGAALEASADYVLGASQPALDPRLQISIKLIRWLRSEMARPPTQARRRFFVIVHAHRLTDEAANALLKILEEPQEQTTFVLTTGTPSAMPETIISRCRTVRFADLSPDTIVGLLVRMRGCPTEQAQVAAVVAQGSLARALRFLDDPEQQIPEPLVSFIAGHGTDSALFSTLADLGRRNQSELTDALLIIFREALRHKLGLGSRLLEKLPELSARVLRSDLDYLRRAVRYLLDRDAAAMLYTNPRLSDYTLLSALRAPA